MLQSPEISHGKFLTTKLTLLDESNISHYNCTFLSSVQGFDFESVLSGCLPKEETTVNLQNDCYDRKELEKISSEYAELLKQLEESAEVTLDSVKLCLCNEDLCNSSIKSVFSISVIIWSVVTGFVLSI
ncbi:hypothetical protein HOLleu_35148 [Holothuria leucospilota]|uniref:Uncharacterized protein n=1 Tax=Holothuria leucospilota TaxID=206669 RepID=A0A9Q1BHK5_HOLLE|nr:hypothetical protein HOLleu_35148 [Holothuria leucospilota]